MDREELGYISTTQLLWGYPDLRRKLYAEVRPILINAGETREREKKEKQRQDTTTVHVSAPLAALADESGASTSVTQSGVQADSQSNIYTPALDGRSSRLHQNAHAL